jgi:hypothetical protein
MRYRRNEPEATQLHYSITPSLQHPQLRPPLAQGYSEVAREQAVQSLQRRFRAAQAEAGSVFREKMTF